MTPDRSSADARLAASRDRLRLALCANSARSPNNGATAADCHIEPLAALQCRLQAVATVCNGVAKATVAPMAQKHPWKLVAGAFVVGGAVAFLRPWRWISGPTLVARLLPLPMPVVATNLSTWKWSELVLPLLQQLLAPRR